MTTIRSSSDIKNAAEALMQWMTMNYRRDRYGNIDISEKCITMALETIVENFDIPARAARDMLQRAKDIESINLMVTKDDYTYITIAQMRLLKFLHPDIHRRITTEV